jgi:hypothetical protein
VKESVKRVAQGGRGFQIVYGISHLVLIRDFNWHSRGKEVVWKG